MANLSNSKFTQLLTQTAKAAEKHKLLVMRVNDECIARYGISYSDVDADTIIDNLNYIGGDSFTEKEFDDDMKLNGRERIDLIAGKLKKLPELSEEQQATLDDIESKIA